MGCHSIALILVFTSAALTIIPASGQELSQQTLTTTTTTTVDQSQVVQVALDEFNTTERSTIRDTSHTWNHTQKDYPLNALRSILLSASLDECCLPWANLTAHSQLQDELKKRFGKGRQTFRAEELLSELKSTFFNVTYLFIDGQPGQSERDKYYSYHDGVQYYLRLVKVSLGYLEDRFRSRTQVEFDRYFRRQVNSILYRVSRDPVLVGFISELFNKTDKFELYEDFIESTLTGQYYAHNISMARESVMVFNQIYSQLINTDFPSNFTRPSSQYKAIRRMSYELYLIKNELVRRINVRTQQNREDIQSIFAKLNYLADIKPYTKLLGDEFSPYPLGYSENVKRLASLLDSYLTNSLTLVSFYDQLAGLPQDFIILGTGIAHYYETREIIHHDRFDFEYTFEPPPKQQTQNTTSSGRTSTPNATLARRIGRMMYNIFNF